MPYFGEKTPYTGQLDECWPERFFIVDHHEQNTVILGTGCKKIKVSVSLLFLIKGVIERLRTNGMKKEAENPLYTRG